ncbi:hypothetical protein ABZY31_29325 [Streptomyces sp. NPDC006529]|uniref:LppU/SCO3897 family protein n=1 Tax=Streptomyces sp. NPDC006529 TaxID=3157177 RepID=UPI0033A874EF
MSSQEIPISLTPQQAAHGVILPVPLASGTARLRIPVCKNGDLVRARLGETEVLLRVAVRAEAAEGPVPPVPPAPQGRSGSRGGLVAAGIATAVIIGLIVANLGDDGDTSTASSSPTATSTPTDTATPTPSYSAWTPPAAPPPPAPADTPAGTAPYPVLPTPEAAPSPFDRGTCLNGTLPDSTTAQRVDDVREVPCSASDAHYKVIESIPGTSDMNRCDANPKTEYGFSYRYSRGGITLNEYVYCVVGIGSYAR